MQPTIKRSTDTKLKRESLSKDDSPKSQDDKKKTYNISTPRNYLPKSSTADIYGQKKKGSPNSSTAKAPKKSLNSTNLVNNVSPMKDQLKSSSSSTSIRSSVSTVSSSREKIKLAAQRKEEAKVSRNSSSKVKEFNVTVNSPAAKRRLNLEREKSYSKEREKSFILDSSKKVKPSSKGSDSKSDTQKVVSKPANERQRTKTRTLDENEAKILRPEPVDNNLEMINLTRRLAAKPKAYYIDLVDDKATQIEKQERPKTPSDEELSYEDDFDSYESDFDSYQSSSPSDHDGSDDKSEEGDEHGGEENEDARDMGAVEKEVKDDEKMLDSGSFDLRDQRSATKTKPMLDFILETAEGGEDKRISLPDEGFQEMSSSSAVSSIKTVHIDVLDRPLFIDFTKSKENKRKKRVNDRLKQRAKDLLSIITLHEMSFTLFEMKPISYDLFMAIFGRSNYQQVAAQTFDDGITEEVQTDEIETDNKWTQHPVEFSKSDICFSNNMNKRKYSNNTEDYLTKFTFLITQTSDLQKNNEINLNESYKTDPLRIYFEQKNGFGPSEMLPYETYKSKLKNNEYSTVRLGKFLKKMENKISNILNTNSGNTDISELKLSKFPFSKGYVTITTKNMTDEKFKFLNNSKISFMYFSETKNNLIMTVHKTALNTTNKKCTICLWDIGVARREPLRILIAIDNVVIGRFKGGTDGFFVAALADGSIHVWDLSEEPTWRADVASDEQSKQLVETNEKDLTQFERDRQWNQMNSHVGLAESNIHCPLQACSYTNSACNMSNGDSTNNIVGLEFTGDQTATREGRKLVGQVVALQRTGILTTWSIIQERSKTVPPDIGKAYWSKMKLEKSQTINLLDYIDIPLNDTQNNEFNLNAAKRRLLNRKQERNIIRASTSRPKSGFDSDRPTSAASVKNKKVLPIQKDFSKILKSGVVCYDLKVVFWKNSDCYLIAKNCGEVLCCTRALGAVRVDPFCITTDASSVTCLEASPQKLPYFLAATDGGTISVCSLVENRVLLTLDCQNIPNQEVQKCHSDHKGRYISTVATKAYGGHDTRVGTKLRLSTLSWSRVNPCCIFASLDGSVVSWDLSHSDIYAKCACDDAATACIAGESTLALLTTDGEIQVHKLTNEHKTKEYLQLFEKYVALL